MQQFKNELLVFFPIDKPYFAGDVVKGHVELKVAVAMKILKVECEYYGIEAIERESNKKRNVLFQINTVLKGKGSEPGKQDFVSGLLKFGKNLLGGKKDVTQLTAGSYKYPFELKLPSRLPGTFMGSQGKIVYQIKFRAVTVKGTTPLVSVVNLGVKGSLMDLNFIGNNSVPAVESHQKKFMLSKNQMKFTLSLPSRIFSAGTNLNGDLICNNGTSKEIPKIKLSLVQTVKYDKKTETNVLWKKNIGSLKKKEGNKKISFQVPLHYGLPETIFPLSQNDLPSVGNCKPVKLIELSYGLEVDGPISMAQDLKMGLNNIYIVAPELIPNFTNRKKEQPKEQKNLQQTQQPQTMQQPQIIPQQPQMNPQQPQMIPQQPHMIPQQQQMIPQQPQLNQQAFNPMIFSPEQIAEQNRMLQQQLQTPVVQPNYENVQETMKQLDSQFISNEEMIENRINNILERDKEYFVNEVKEEPKKTVLPPVPQKLLEKKEEENAKMMIELEKERIKTDLEDEQTLDNLMNKVSIPDNNLPTFEQEQEGERELYPQL